MKYKTQTPYAASYILLTRKGKVAFVLRANTGWCDGYYGLVSGKVEQHESFSEAAIREGKEEADVVVTPSQLKYVHTQHRNDDSDDRTWVDVFFEVTEWQGEPRNAEPRVHSELTWFALDALPANIVPNVQTALDAIRRGKTYSEFGWN